MNWSDHLIVLPILIPLVAGAILVPMDEARRGLRFGIAAASALAQLVVAVLLLALADGQLAGWNDSVGAYVAANWPVPYGIALAVDRLTALMLLLGALVHCACVLFSRARAERAGVHFHSLLQFLAMGVNGAFLTADLFNLFVFFEVMLAASYGLLLHGSGAERVKAGLHYVAVNLVASSFLLIGVALVYGVGGTLSMADLARVIPRVHDSDRMLLEAGLAMMAMAFLVKAAVWPLNFWLVPAYAAASAPVAAAFALLTKVGVYVIIRLWVLLLADHAGPSTGFGGDVLLYGGLITLAYGTVGMLAANDLRRLGGFSILMSSGLLMAAVGYDDVSVLGAALYYLASASLAAAALFMLIELIERSRVFGAGVLAVTLEMFERQGALHGPGDEPGEEPGVVIPAAMAFLGLAFVGCGLIIAGLPPLSGFLAKFSLLHAMLNPGDAGASSQQVRTVVWWLLGLIVFSGLAAATALSRIGIREFWVPVRQSPPRLRVIEVAPIAGLLGVALWLAVQAGPVMRYMDAAAQSLRERDDYVKALLSAPRVPSPAGALTQGKP